jgi:hypothetical protein
MGQAKGDPQARESQRRASGKRLVLTRKELGVEYQPKIATNEYSERDNHRKALTGGRYCEEAPANASCGKIVQEAKASEKVSGYADVDTVVWKIEDQ